MGGGGGEGGVLWGMLKYVANSQRVLYMKGTGMSVGKITLWALTITS